MNVLIWHLRECENMLDFVAQWIEAESTTVQTLHRHRVSPAYRTDDDPDQKQDVEEMEAQAVLTQKHLDLLLDMVEEYNSKWYMPGAAEMEAK